LIGDTNVKFFCPNLLEAPHPTNSKRDCFPDENSETDLLAYSEGNLILPKSDTHFTNPVPKSRPIEIMNINFEFDLREENYPSRNESMRGHHIVTSAQHVRQIVIIILKMV